MSEEHREAGSKSVSVVVCTLNCVDEIERVLFSARNAGPQELIVVDANSTDGTREIAERLADYVVSDPGKGLAVARQIGLDIATGEYIFYLGPDNTIPSTALSETVGFLAKTGWIGCGLLTRIEEPTGYLSRGLDFRWKTRFFPGPRRVIGTPFCYRRKQLQRYGFTAEMSWSDDTELGERLAADGRVQGYSDVRCYEIGFETPEAILNRFVLYGRSDHEFYEKYRRRWTLMRKLRSRLHPFLAEFVMPFLKSSWQERLVYGPFLMIVTCMRYRGWFRAYWNSRMERTR